MRVQSTNHILLVEPDQFFSNPETRGTNPYQIQKNPDDLSDITKKAIEEHRNFRNELIAHGITVTTAKGGKDTPDGVFGGNCYSTHQEGIAYVYSMMAENRRREKTEFMNHLVTKMYNVTFDYTDFERKELFLEGTGSMVMDHVNKVVYATHSDRTNEDMIQKWCEKMDYEPILFHSKNHIGEDVYHTDLVLYIGTNVAGFVSGCVDDEDAKRVRDRLSKTHEIVEFTKEQLAQFVGNCLELRNHEDKKFLVMSDAAYQALTKEQESSLSKHFEKILHPAIPTIEKYGGGSARCLILELF